MIDVMLCSVIFTVAAQCAQSSEGLQTTKTASECVFAHKQAITLALNCLKAAN